MTDYIKPFLYLLEEMAPYLLFGFLMAGILHVFVPSKFYHKCLAGNNSRSVLTSLLVGIPLPLCSCGVIPTAVSMRKEGASKAAITAFLIGTPQTGVDSIVATWSVLGLPFAILRPIVALVTGFCGGMVTAFITSREEHSSELSSVKCVCSNGVGQAVHKSFAAKCREALKYGFTDMVQDIGRWLVIGLVLAALITIFVPDNFFTQYAGHGIIGMLLILLIAVPMYVCATGSIPIAASLILKGLTPGMALVFLMAGPATNIASMLILSKTIGRKPLIAYLMSIVVGAIVFGLIVDSFLPPEWFTSAIGATYHSSCCHINVATPWWQVVSTWLLVGLIIRAWVLKIIKSRIEQKTKDMTKSFIVKGMVCNHCKAAVERTIAGTEGVTSVRVDLASGKVVVEGVVEPQTIISVVSAIGYECIIES